MGIPLLPQSMSEVLRCQQKVTVGTERDIPHRSPCRLQGHFLLRNAPQHLPPLKCTNAATPSPTASPAFLLLLLLTASELGPTCDAVYPTPPALQLPCWLLSGNCHLPALTHSHTAQSVGLHSDRGLRPYSSPPLLGSHMTTSTPVRTSRSLPRSHGPVQWLLSTWLCAGFQHPQC